MDGEIHKLSRRDLYDLVWKTPVDLLAKEFGLSGVGLAKICQRYSVPVPPRGYWAKARTGKRVVRPPLLEIDAPRQEEPKVPLLLPPAEPSAATPNGNAARYDELRQQLLAEIPALTVPATLRKPFALAAWPLYSPLRERWIMRELVAWPSEPPNWRNRRIRTPASPYTAEIYSTRSAAVEAAQLINARFAADLLSADLNDETRTSLQLKGRKALASLQRLQNEEALMSAEAHRRSAKLPSIDALKILLPNESEHLREQLIGMLKEFPELDMAMLGSPIQMDGQKRPVLYRRNEYEWTIPYPGGETAGKKAERAKIACGFGFSSKAHWGKTKAAIREMLLPKANKLLQLASVKRLLDEALDRGDKVLVCNGIVFWYEEDGSVGWQVKEVAATRETEKSSLWVEGSILSKNHGRLVVLPYIKDDGERVSGHTKNGPNEGRAKPRHHRQYVEIPFREIDGDLMIGLFGEIQYE